MIVRRHKGGEGRGYKKSQSFNFASQAPEGERDPPDVRAEKDALIAQFLAKYPEKRLRREDIAAGRA